MPELRWTLLILGVLFLAGLAWWEVRRTRRAAAGRLPEPPGDGLFARDEPPISGAASHAPGGSHEHAAHREKHEPTLSLPEIHARDPMAELPVVEVTDDSMIGLRIDGAPEENLDAPAEEPVEPIVPSPPAPEPEESAESIPLLGIAPLPTPTDPIVDWPDESVRRIVALRLVALGERFPGRAVRQALVAEGFVLGKLSIFHRSGPDGRAIVSAASLTKPGTFDRDSIDMQRYGGLNLFAVLPGPLPPAKAFDELLSSARNLSERLQGALHDEQGEPLTPMRAAMIREALAGEAETSG
jgi:cell division protein ZipA